MDYSKPEDGTAVLVYAEQVALLYRSAPLAFAVTLVNGLVLIFVQRGQVAVSVLVGWFTCLMLITASRAILARLYANADHSGINARRWGRAYLVGTGLAGMTWGSTAVFLFPADSIAHQVVVAFVLAGMTAGAMAVLAARMEAAIAFMLPALLPLAVQFLAAGSELQLAMGVMTLFFLAGMSIAARTIHRSIRRALRLHLHNGQLLQRLEEDKAMTERLNAELVAEIADRRQAEQALRESEEKYRNTMDAALAGIYVIQDLRFQYVNPTMARLFGYLPQELEGKLGPLDLILPEQGDVVRTRLIECANGVLHEPCEIKCLRKDGSVFEAMAWAQATLYQGRPAAVGTLIDISERKRAEEHARTLQAQLAHIARLSIAGEMAAGLAHELNQPLTAIAAFAEACQIMIRGPRLDHVRILDTLEQLAAQSQRAGEIIRRMRTFTRKTEPRRSTIDVNALVREMARFIEAEALQREVVLRLELGERLPAVFADPVQIQQVILNLIRNAMEAMQDIPPDSRRLSIRTKASGLTAVEIAVADTGPGLSAAEIERLFHPFYTTKPTGMGLGLSISKSIIEAHEGQLAVQTGADAGAIFRFTLPTAHAAHYA